MKRLALGGDGSGFNYCRIPANFLSMNLEFFFAFPFPLFPSSPSISSSSLCKFFSAFCVHLILELSALLQLAAVSSMRYTCFPLCA
ncbi:hypothetical protein GGI35DRAFT_53536 [Trichoderma velutinum]